MLNTWIESFIVEGTVQIDEAIWGNGVSLGIVIAGAEESGWELESLVTALGEDYIDVAVRAAICVKVLIKVYRGIVDIKEEEGIDQLIKQFLRVTERIEEIGDRCGAMMSLIILEYNRCFGYSQKKYADRAGILKVMKAAYVLKGRFGFESSIYLLTESEIEMLDSLHMQSDDTMLRLFAKCYEIIIKSELSSSDFLSLTVFNKLYEFIHKTSNQKILDTIKLMIENIQPALSHQQRERLNESWSIKNKCEPEPTSLVNSLLHSTDWPVNANKHCEKESNEWAGQSDSKIRHYEERSNRSGISRNRFRNRNSRRFQKFGRGSSECINTIDKATMEEIKYEIYYIFDNIRSLIMHDDEISLEFISDSLYELSQISSTNAIFEILKNRSYGENRSNQTSIKLWRYIIMALESINIFDKAQIDTLNNNLNRIEKRGHRGY